MSAKTTRLGGQARSIPFESDSNVGWEATHSLCVCVCFVCRMNSLRSGLLESLSSELNDVIWSDLAVSISVYLAEACLEICFVKNCGRADFMQLLLSVYSKLVRINVAFVELVNFLEDIHTHGNCLVFLLKSLFYLCGKLLEIHISVETCLLAHWFMQRVVCVHL